MDSRRTVLKRLLAGTAGAAALPGGTSVALEAVGQATGLDRVLPSGPAPWGLLSPLTNGTTIGLGWSLKELSALKMGASVLTLVHTSGKTVEVHLCARKGSPRGIASTRVLDLILMDGNTGSESTDEALGRVVLGIAGLIRKNEADATGELVAVARMLSHDERIERFGAEALV